MSAAVRARRKDCLGVWHISQDSGFLDGILKEDRFELEVREVLW